VILHPRLSRAFQIGPGIEVVPEAGWQQTLYRTESQQFAERGLFTARTDIRTRLVRDYFNEQGRVTRHVLEPRLGWALVTQRQQRQNPHFVPRGAVAQTRLRTLALESVTRDPSDRIESTNKLVLGLGQRWYAAAAPGRAPRILGDLATAIDYDFSDSGGLGAIVAEGHVFPVGPMAGSFRAAWDPEALAFEEGGAQVTLSFADDNPFVQRLTFFGGYSYLRRPPRFFESDASDSSAFESSGDSELNQLDFAVQIEVIRRWRLTYGAIYELAKDARGFIRNRGMVEYVSKCKCWGAGVRLDYENRDGFQGGFMIRFIGLGDERGSIFDGGLGTGVNL
jgi:lipopolysaccharide assembly outer membrane protein LptD (OstA)